MEDLEPVENVYKGGFFKNRHRLSWRAPIVVNALSNTFGLTVGSRVVDVGCGIGDYVKEFNDRKICANGIEGSSAAKEFFVHKNIIVQDLREPIFEGKPIKRYDLAFSLEVAEHIDPMSTGVYCDNLCSLSDTILISAATPGQKGHGHVNCAPRMYWIEKFKRRGYLNMKGIENTWRNQLSGWVTKKELSSYIRNGIIFKRRNI